MSGDVAGAQEGGMAGPDQPGWMQSLMSPDASPVRSLPDVVVLKVGGQSIMDRGRQAVFPVVGEIVANRPAVPLVIGAGGGTRSRHAYSIALDLNMPTGILAKLGGSVSRQNARMLYMLLAPHGGMFIPDEHFEFISICLRAGGIPVLSGMPPYEYWERPPERGRIPESRTDVGVYLTAEVLGARSVIFVKDEDGLYTADPKKHPRAEFIDKISVAELRRLDLADLVVERKVLDLLESAQHVRRIQIVNGLKPGTLTRALAGEPVGSVIYAGE